MGRFISDLLGTRANITFGTLLLLPLIIIVVKILWDLIMDIICLIWAILVVIGRRFLSGSRAEPVDRYKKKAGIGYRYTEPDEIKFAQFAGTEKAYDLLLLFLCKITETQERLREEEALTISKEEAAQCLGIREEEYELQLEDIRNQIAESQFYLRSRRGVEILSDRLRVTVQEKALHIGIRLTPELKKILSLDVNRAYIMDMAKRKQEEKWT